MTSPLHDQVLQAHNLLHVHTTIGVVHNVIGSFFGLKTKTTGLMTGKKRRLLKFGGMHGSMSTNVFILTFSLRFILSAQLLCRIKNPGLQFKQVLTNINNIPTEPPSCYEEMYVHTTKQCWIAIGPNFVHKHPEQYK